MIVRNIGLCVLSIGCPEGFILIIFGQSICGSVFYRCDKLERMVQTVLEKEPKVQSTAIKQMRRKARELLKKYPKISFFKIKSFYLL